MYDGEIRILSKRRSWPSERASGSFMGSGLPALGPVRSTSKRKARYCETPLRNLFPVKLTNHGQSAPHVHQRHRHQRDAAYGLECRFVVMFCYSLSSHPLPLFFLSNVMYLDVS